MPKQPAASKTVPSIGAMALYSLVSRSMFESQSSSNFFANLLPFFEPYVASVAGELFDFDGFTEYAKTEIFMPLNKEVAEIFVKRMVDVHWLRREVGSQEGIIYRVTYERTVLDSAASDVQADLSHLVRDIVEFAKAKFGIDLNIDGRVLADQLLNFLVRTASSREADIVSVAPQSKEFPRERADYVFSRYVAEVEKRSPHIFDGIAKITGVALLAEALSEIRNPSIPKSKAATDLTVFLDGPLAMDYCGASGHSSQQSASFTIDHLRSLGANICILKQSCDEIKANLQAMYTTPPIQRHGLTHTALINKEVTDDECRYLMNSPENALKTTKKVVTLPHTPAMFKQNENFCPDNIISELADAMPSSNETARKRDAYAIAIVMRRRGGYFTDQIFKTKFIFLTSNDAVVSAANKLLRGTGLLPEDKATYGPALHQRTMAGLLFANVGLAERIEVSRTTVLSACARMAMLRPKLLEQMRDQLKSVTSIQNDELLEALLMQPRGGEIVMDFTVGASHTVSARNREKLLEALRQGLTSELGEKHKMELDDILGKMKEDNEKWTEEVGSREQEVNHLRGELITVQQAVHSNEQRFDKIAIAVASTEVRRVGRIEVALMIVFAVLAIAVFCAPLMWTSGQVYNLAAWATALLSAGGFFALVLNRQFNFFDGVLQSVAEKRVAAALQQQGLEDYIGRMHVVYRPHSVELLRR